MALNLVIASTQFLVEKDGGKQAHLSLFVNKKDQLVARSITKHQVHKVSIALDLAAAGHPRILFTVEEIAGPDGAYPVQPLSTVVDLVTLVHLISNITPEEIHAISSRQDKLWPSG